MKAVPKRLVETEVSAVDEVALVCGIQVVVVSRDKGESEGEEEDVVIVHEIHGMVRVRRENGWDVFCVVSF